MAPGFTLTVSVMADGLPSPSGRGAGGEGFRAQQAVYSRSSGPRSPHPSPLPQGEGTYRLHEAACALRVDPDLQVKIECHRHGDASAPPRPGEAADVTVTTCDAQGKPVAAEVSLAILPTDRGTDGALSGISLPSFFRTRGRTAQFQAASSIQFHYRPAIHALATAEPEEDVAAVPAHLAAQQGVPMPKPDARKPARTPAAAEDPFGGSPTAPAPSASVPSVPSDDPFGGEEPAQQVSPGRPVQKAAATRQRPNRRSERESTVSRIPHPTWSGYWNPSITTGPDGRATIALTLPEDALNLTLVAKAITPETLAGQASQTLDLKKDLWAAIHLPPAFTDGDEVELPVVVQNQVLDRGTLEVAISANIDGVAWNDKKTLEVKSRGRLETSFKTTIRLLQRPGQESGCLSSQPQAEFTVAVKAGAQSDACRRIVPILPYGEPCQVTTSGVASGEATVTIAPSRHHWTTPKLQVAVSPSIERSLLDLLAPAGNAGHLLAGRGVPYEGQSTPTWNAAEGVPYSLGTEGLPAASDLMAALALAKLCPADSPERSTLDERIRTTLSLLIAGQHDGTWPVDGHAGTVATTAQAHWSLVLADKAGFDVPKEILASSLARLRGSAGGDKESDLETKAIVLHALAIGGQGDFALANQLLRDRKLLSPLGRAYLALALVQMDRKETATEVLGARSPGSSRNPKDIPPKGGTTNPDIPPKGGTPTDETPTETEAQAVTALALLGLDPASPQAKVLIETILGQRAGLRWTPEKATGPAVLAATTWLAKDRAAAGACRLAITVNGKPVKTLDLDPQGPTQTVEVPLALLVKGQQRIELHPSGPARLAYRCTLEGVDPAEFVQGSSASWSIRRSYQPGLMEVDENEISRGFSVLSGDASRGEFANRMTQLPAARRGCVGLEIHLPAPAGRGAEGESFPSPFGRGAGGEGSASPELLIVEPLPSGAKVVPSSLEGCFDRAEILPGRIVFFLSRVHWDGSIRYDLEGVFPGSNLVSPTVLRRVGHGVPLAVAKPKSLVVLPQGVRSTDPYRLSPDELLALGTIAKGKGEADAATKYFTELLDSWHGQPGFGLSDAAYKQTIVALMELGMGRGPGQTRAVLRSHQGKVARSAGDARPTADRRGGLPRDRRDRAELHGLPRGGRRQLHPRERRGRVPRQSGRVPPQRQPHEPALARLSARALSGRGRDGVGPAGLRQGRGGPGRAAPVTSSPGAPA